MTVPPENESEIGLQAPFQSEAEDANQEPLVSGARTSSVAIGPGAGDGNHPTSE